MKRKTNVSGVRWRQQYYLQKKLHGHWNTIGRGLGGMMAGWVLGRIWWDDTFLFFNFILKYASNISQKIIPESFYLIQNKVYSARNVW